MPINYPQRPNSHQLEEQSQRYFTSKLPENWTCEKPDYDYGIDLKVDIYEETNATGLEFLVQLKSSELGNNLDYETINLSVSTYNYLWDKVQVVILIKYIKEEDKAYWILLSDVNEPSQEQQTFTIRLPKENNLDNIEWNRVQQFIRTVTNDKLSARRRGRFSQES